MKKEMEVSFKPINGEYELILGFQEGLAFVRNNESKVGYIDKTGEVAIPLDYYCRFESSQGRTKFVHYPGFYEGVSALINEEGKFGFIDQRNRIVIPFEYDNAYCFQDGLSPVKKMINGDT